MEFNIDEIIRALKCFASGPNFSNCAGCYFDGQGICEQNCTEDLADIVLQAIFYLVNECERLEVLADRLGKDVDIKLEHICRLEDVVADASKEVKGLKEENEMLHASCTELTQCCTKLETLYKIECKRVDTVKANTVHRMQSGIQAACLNGGIWPAFVARVVKGVGDKILEENNV